MPSIELYYRSVPFFLCLEASSQLELQMGVGWRHSRFRIPPPKISIPGLLFIHAVKLR